MTDVRLIRESVQVAVVDDAPVTRLARESVQVGFVTDGATSRLHRLALYVGVGPLDARRPLPIRWGLRHRDL